MDFKALTIGFVGMIALGCSANVKVDPVEVKPIKMTIDINIKVDRQLEEFFDFEENMVPDEEVEAENKGARE